MTKTNQELATHYEHVLGVLNKDKASASGTSNLSLEELICKAKTMLSESIEQYSLGIRVYTESGRAVRNDLVQMHYFKLYSAVEAASSATGDAVPYAHGKLAGIYDTTKHFFALHYCNSGEFPGGYHIMNDYSRK